MPYRHSSFRVLINVAVYRVDSKMWLYALGTACVALDALVASPFETLDAKNHG